MWKKISVGGVVYFTVLCDHPYLVSLLFAVLVSLHPVTFSNVFYYLYNIASAQVTVTVGMCKFMIIVNSQYKQFACNCKYFGAVSS